MLIIILFCFSCMNEPLRKETLSFNESVEKIDTHEQGIFSIELISEDELLLRNVNVRLSNTIPEITRRTVFQIRPAFRIAVPMLEEIDNDPIVNMDVIKSFKHELNSNKKVSHVIKEGSYYISLDNIESDSLSFSPIESKLILFMFGYKMFESEPTSFFDFKYKYRIAKYENHQGCSYRRNSYNLDIDRTGKEIAECPKISIEKGKETIVRIKSSSLELNSFDDIFLKIIPGIIILAPFTNYGYFYHRNYDIEILSKDIQ